jgi:hypothetical protein
MPGPPRGIDAGNAASRSTDEKPPAQGAGGGSLKSQIECSQLLAPPRIALASPGGAAGAALSLHTGKQIGSPQHV